MRPEKVPTVCTWHFDRKDEAVVFKMNLEDEILNAYSPAPVPGPRPPSLSPPTPHPLPPCTPTLPHHTTPAEDSTGAVDALWLLTSPEMLVWDPASRVCLDRERCEFPGLDLRSGSELSMF